MRVIPVREFEAAVRGGRNLETARPEKIDPQTARDITEEYRNYLGLKK